jgi:radical SAM protein with 4Fe4S-binding SPASM domain
VETEEDATRYLVAADILFANGWVAKALQIYRNMAADGHAVGIDKFRRIMQAYDALDPATRDLPGQRHIAFVGDHVVSTLHFNSNLNEYEKKVAFLSGVRMVELETSSQCNRRCHYCPNSKYDRISGNTYISDAVFNRVIDDLASVDYAWRLHFHGYNEPLMHFDNLVTRIQTARKRLPKASLCIFTNGDYLTKDMFCQLEDSGINAVILSVHMPPNKPWNERDVLQRIFDKANELDQKAMLTEYDAGKYMKFLLLGSNMTVSIHEGNYDDFGSNRGNLLPSVGEDVDERTRPCFHPMMFFIVNYRGDVVPCCDFVGDIPEHRPYVVGNVADASLFDIYANEKYTDWRINVLSTGKKPVPCNTCSQFDKRKRFDDDTQNLIDKAIAEAVAQKDGTLAAVG